MKFSNLIFAVACLMIFTGSIPASDLDIDLAVGTSYDDNILNYSDADLDQLDDSTVTDNKYGLESKSDIMITPAFEITYKPIIAGHSTHIGLNGKYYYYLDNDIKRYYRLGGFIRRYFDRGLYAEVSASYLPDYYYRNTYSSEVGYQEAKFDKLSIRGKLSARLLSKFRLNLIYQYATKDFITIFDERDIDGHEFEGELIYYYSRAFKLWGSSMFSTYTSAGAGNSSYERDTSYDSFEFRLGSRLYFNGFFGRAASLGFLGIYERFIFQTDNLSSADRYRFAREDNRIEIRINPQQEITNRLGVELDFSYISKTTDLPAIDLKQFLEYTSYTVGITLKYSF